MARRDTGGTRHHRNDRSPASGKTAGSSRKDLELPRWLPPVLFGAVTLLLFRKFVFSGSMLLGMDTLSLGFVARDFFAGALKSGTFPLWNPIILGGTPFLDSLAGGDSLYPTSLLLLLMEPFRALGWKLVIHVFLGGLFMYGWVRALGRSRPAALLSGLAFLLAPFMVTLVYPGHDGKLFVTALTPLMFWTTERALTGGGIRALAAMAVTIALIIFTTHFQQAYFLFGAVGAYALVRCILLWRQGRGEGAVAGIGGRRAATRFGLFLVFSLLGTGVAAIQLLPAVSYVTEHSRRTATTTRAEGAQGVAYSSSWSLHPEEVASLVVPEFVGSSVGGADWATQSYWGRNPFKLNHEYAGLVVLLLAMVGFFGTPARGIRFTLLGIGGVALLYALGTHTPVWRAFYEVVPGISLFRAPSIAAFLFGFAAVTLMAFGVDRVLGLGTDAGLSGEGKGERGMLLTLAGATGLLLVGTVLAAAGKLDSVWSSIFFSDMELAQRQILALAEPFITRGFVFSTCLAAALLGLVWAGRRGRIPPLAWVVAVGALVILDEARVDDPFIQVMEFQEWAAPDANLLYLQDRLRESEEPFRLLSFGGRVGAGQDVKPGMYGLELAAGHHPNDLARYRDLIGMRGSGWPQNLLNTETGRVDAGLLSILNVRYVLWPVHQFGNFPVGEAVSATSMDGQNAYEAVYELPTLPRARLVGRAVVKGEEETVPYLLSEAFRPEEEVVLGEEPPLSLPGAPVEGDVEILDREINRHRFRVRSRDPALLVLSENWYPAWEARVGGEDAPVLRANHTLRAVPVPAGEHEVEVYFAGSWLAGPLAVSLVSVLLLAASVVFDRRRRAGGRGRRSAFPESPDGGPEVTGA